MLACNSILQCSSQNFPSTSELMGIDLSRSDAECSFATGINQEVVRDDMGTNLLGVLGMG